MAAAHAKNETTLHVQANAVVTPSARDAAAACGMEIVREPCSGRTAPAADAHPADLDLAREVKRRVLASLPPEKHNDPLIDQLVTEALKKATSPLLAPLAAPMSAPDVYAACRAACLNTPKRIVFPDALDPRVLRAAADLHKKRLARPVLLGNPPDLHTAAAQNGLALEGCRLVDHTAPDLLQQNAADILAAFNRGGRELTRDEALHLARSPLFAGALMVHRGEADLGIGGNLSTTADVIRAGLRAIGLADDTKTVFGLFFMLSPSHGTIQVYADCAVIPEPTGSQLADIAIGSAQTLARLTGETPRVALLSFSTKGSADHPTVARIRQALAEIKERQPDLTVDGELQFDAATDSEAARLKAPGSPVAGKVNVFVFPDLEAGNIAYKVAQRLGGYDALGPFLVGFAKGWHDLSRGCSTGDIVKTSIIGSALARGSSPAALPAMHI